MSENEVVQTSFVLHNGYNDPIYGRLRYVPGSGKQSTIIMCHSFMAFSEWGFFPYAAARIARSGFVVVTFDFSLNGVAADGNKITEFEKFEQNTFSRELHDLGIVTDALQKNDLGVDELDPNRIALLGHSRGGGVGIVFSSRDARIRALATWSAISTFDRWTDHQKKGWRESGFLPLARDSTVSPLRLGVGLLDDYEHHRDELTITKAATALRVPWLIIHGKADVMVPSSEAGALYAASDKKRSELILLDHIGHLYNASTPGLDGYETLDQVLELTTHWLQRQLS